MTNTYTLINYFDVWGNEVDGYEVNNQCVEATDVIIADDATDQDIINYLFQHEYLNDDGLWLYEIENNGDFIEIFAKETMMPLYGLRRNYDSKRTN